MAVAQPAELTIRERLGVQPPSQAVTHLNLLIYGEIGVGKTLLASTAQDHPDTAPVCFLDIEGGVTTIRHRDDIDVRTIRYINNDRDPLDPESLNGAYELLRRDTDRLYSTVVIDSLSELQQLDMHDVLRARDEKRDDLKGEPASKREWGIAAEHVRRIVRAFRDLPYHTIFTCQERQEREGGDSGPIVFGPSLPGQLKVHVPGFLDIVGRLSTAEKEGEIVRQLQLAKTRRTMAKDRTNALGELIESPSIPLMWEMIKTGGTQ